MSPALDETKTPNTTNKGKKRARSSSRELDVTVDHLQNNAHDDLDLLDQQRDEPIQSSEEYHYIRCDWPCNNRELARRRHPNLCHKLLWVPKNPNGNTQCAIERHLLKCPLHVLTDVWEGKGEQATGRNRAILCQWGEYKSDCYTEQGVGMRRDVRVAQLDRHVMRVHVQKTDTVTLNIPSPSLCAGDLGLEGDLESDTTTHDSPRKKPKLSHDIGQVNDALEEDGVVLDESQSARPEDFFDELFVSTFHVLFDQYVEFLAQGTGSCDAVEPETTMFEQNGLGDVARDETHSFPVLTATHASITPPWPSHDGSIDIVEAAQNQPLLDEPLCEQSDLFEDTTLSLLPVLTPEEWEAARQILESL